MGRLRLVRDQNFRFNKTKKSTETQCKSSTNGSDDGNDIGTQITSINQNYLKKQQLMTKLKPAASSKLQVGVKTDNHGMHYQYFV